MAMIGTKLKIHRETNAPIAIAAITQNKQSIIQVRSKAKSLSILFISLENLFITYPLGVISKYLFIGAFNSLLII